MGEYLAKIGCLIIAAVCLVIFVSCGNNSDCNLDFPDGNTICKIEDYEISDTVYNYYKLNAAESDNKTEDESKELTEKQLKRDYALIILSKENNISLNDNDKNVVESNLESLKNQLGEEAFNENLDNFHMTLDLYKYLMELQTLETNLRLYITDEASNCIVADDDTVIKDINDNFYAAKQILISNDDGDDIDANRTLAEDVLQKLKDGEEFDVLCNEFNEDSNMDIKYGRYFTTGMFPEIFEDTVKNMKIGDMSDVIESDVGFHIVIRMPIDEDYVNDNFETLRYYYLSKEFNRILNSKSDTLNVVYEK